MFGEARDPHATRERSARTDRAAVKAIIPMMPELEDNAIEHVPALAKALISLHGG